MKNKRSQQLCSFNLAKFALYIYIWKYITHNIPSIRYIRIGKHFFMFLLRSVLHRLQVQVSTFNFCFHKIGRLSHETLYKVTSWISSGTVTSKPNWSVSALLTLAYVLIHPNNNTVNTVARLPNTLMGANTNKGEIHNLIHSQIIWLKNLNQRTYC
jgi:hypothetical protein